MTKLSVNVNKIALLRNARSLELNLPDVCEAARVIVQAGAYGITVHPRPDERHIHYDDAYRISEMLRKEFAGTEYNIEGNPFTGRYMQVVSELVPDQATLVPDEVGANTSDHGWDLNKKNQTRLIPVVEKLKSLNIRVSIFMDAAAENMKAAAELGADRIELYTEPYAVAFRKNENLKGTIERYAQAAQVAVDAGLGVNAGHDLNLINLGRFIEQVDGVLEVSIGHALIAEALYEGLEAVVKKYLAILQG
jgi:pyridoxine 5-phosphate synthase